MKTKINLLLILVLAFSSIAWIGLPPQQADMQETSTAPQFKAIISGHSLIIDGKSFNRRHTYNVRVRPNAGEDWTRIATVRPNGEGKIHSSFRLPRELRQGNMLRVCLKDTTTNKQYCVKARR